MATPSSQKREDIVVFRIRKESTCDGCSEPLPRGSWAVEAGDVEALALLYAEDAVSYGPDLMVAKGRTAIVDSWAAFFGQFDISELTLYDAHHETCGDFSTAWGQFRMVATPKGGGDELVMEGRFADAARKIDGKWQYVMDHASLPIVAP